MAQSVSTDSFYSSDAEEDASFLDTSELDESLYNVAFDNLSQFLSDVQIEDEESRGRPLWDEVHEEEHPFPQPTPSATPRSWSPDCSTASGDGKRYYRSKSLRSSLKSPQSRKRKKMVRFADAMGLDLERVHHILDREVVEKFSGYGRGGGLGALLSTNVQIRQSSGNLSQKYVAPCFTLPSANQTDRLATEQRVCLQSLTVNDLAVTGVVKVANVAFRKLVYVRFSLDGWRTCTEIQASYIPNSSDGFLDKFVFSLFLPHDKPTHTKCELAIRYVVDSREYWDNCGGKNYVLEYLGGRSEFGGGLSHSGLLELTYSSMDFL